MSSTACSSPKPAWGKLGGRGISAEEAGQIARNPHVIVRNPRGGGEPGARRLLIGRTDGGRTLTLVIEERSTRLRG